MFNFDRLWFRTEFTYTQSCKLHYCLSITLPSQTRINQTSLRLNILRHDFRWILKCYSRKVILRANDWVKEKQYTEMYRCTRQPYLQRHLDSWLPLTGRHFRQECWNIFWASLFVMQVEISLANNLGRVCYSAIWL